MKNPDKNPVAKPPASKLKIRKSSKEKIEKGKKCMFRVVPKPQVDSMENLTAKMQDIISQVPADKRKEFLSNFYKTFQEPKKNKRRNKSGDTQSSKDMLTKRQDSEYTLFQDTSNDN